VSDGGWELRPKSPRPRKLTVARLEGLAETSASNGLYSWRGDSLTPAEPSRVAALSAGQACQIAGGRSDSRDSAASVVLAQTPTVGDRGDPEATDRLVYLVRHQGVSWMPSYPAGSDPRTHRAAVGTRTTLVDAMTGEILGQCLTGTSRADFRGGGPPPRGRSENAGLAPLWSRRVHLDGRFVARVEASLRQLSLDVSLTSSSAVVPAPPGYAISCRGQHVRPCR
jgi:hypothetical protein